MIPLCDFRALLACMRIPHDESAVLAALPFRNERQLLRTMDLAGLSLYFFHHAESRGFAPRLSPWLRGQLEARKQHNRTRVLTMLRELETIQARFAGHDLPVTVLKGISVGECFSPDPFARHQNDTDLLVPLSTRSQSIAVLSDFGYHVSVNSTEQELQMFRPLPESAPAAGMPKMFQPFAESKLELHFHVWDSVPGAHLPPANVDWEHMRTAHVGDVSFRSLPLPELFAQHVIHAFRHLLAQGWVRACWLYEIYFAMQVYRSDVNLWQSSAQLLDHEWRRRPAAMVLALVQRLFACDLPRELQQIAASLSPRDALWLDLCAERLLLSERMETKLPMLVFEGFAAADSEDERSRNLSVFSYYFKQRRLPRVAATLPPADRWLYLARRTFDHTSMKWEFHRYRQRFTKAVAALEHS